MEIDRFIAPEPGQTAKLEILKVHEPSLIDQAFNNLEKEEEGLQLSAEWRSPESSGGS